MATKKYESMRIMSLEGSVLYKNEGFTATKDGKPDPQAFRGILDESLDTLKLAEVYARYEDEMGYLTSLNDSAYVLITANKADIEAIVARFTLSLAN